MLPCPFAVSLHPQQNHYRAHSLALPIQPTRVVSPPLGTVLERVKFESAKQVSIGRGVHDADSPFRGRLGCGYENWQKEFGKVEVAEDVGSKLEVVSIVGDHLYG
jgi:hypothetical protein